MPSPFQILHGDALAVLRTLPDESVHCCVTSPPYFGLRDYGVPGQIGLEPSPAEFVERIVSVFAEVRRVLRSDGTLWINLGDSYANDGKWGGHTGGKHVAALHCSPIGRNKRYTGLKPKDMIGVPWRVAFALQGDGWYLRSDIIWHKPNPMPESVTDRPTKAHEYIFLLSKSAQYYYDAEAIKENASSNTHARTRKLRATDDVKSMPTAEPFRNKRTVWSVTTCPTPEAHFATYPPDLIEPCILAGCPEGGTVLDPFAGAATTGLACMKHGRRFLGIELNPEYINIAEQRARKFYPLLIA